MKGKTYNIYDRIKGIGKVIWGVNPEKKTVTCILEYNINYPNKRYSPTESFLLENKLFNVFVSNGDVSYVAKIIKTSKASHGDTFDLGTGMARSLMKCLISAGLLDNITSLTKFRKLIKESNEDDRNRPTVSEQVEDNEGPVRDSERELDFDRINESLNSIREVAVSVGQAGLKARPGDSNGPEPVDERPGNEADVLPGQTG